MLDIVRKLEDFEQEYTNAILRFQKDPEQRGQLEAVELSFEHWCKQKRDGIAGALPDNLDRELIERLRDDLDAWIREIAGNRTARSKGTA